MEFCRTICCRYDFAEEIGDFQHSFADVVRCYTLECMKKIQIRNISSVPFEGTHSFPNSRQTLATKEDLVTDNIDALTKGIMSPGQIWDWHEHVDHDELCIVLSGKGLFVWENQSYHYQKDDVIIIPAGTKHKIEALGDTNSEFYFIRIKV